MRRTRPGPPRPASARLGHANDRYMRPYTNPPDNIAAGYVEDL
ncbi:hypothetical protein [Sinosporangium album]|nr:hypothetical protein [Sinosporangium album]